MNTHARAHSPSSRALLTAWLVLAALVPGATRGFAPASAFAGEPAAAAPAPGQATPAPAPSAVAGDATAPVAAPTAAPAAATGGAAGDLNFDLLDDGKKTATGPSLEEVKRQQAIERQVRIRRPMLIAHQAIGFVTLAALAATVVTATSTTTTNTRAATTAAATRRRTRGSASRPRLPLGTTGLLAVFAPNPYPKPIRLDTALIHKLSMILATAGMVTQIVLGPITANRVGYQNQSSLALAHVVTGYATWAFMATGTIAYFF